MLSMPVRTGRRDWLWGVALGIVILVVIFLMFVALRPSSVKTYDTIAGVDCQSGERLEYHVHSFLSILVDGEPRAIPAQVGIRDNQCFFWLHTHDATGLVHVEAPEQEDFTVGQFFQVWGQSLSSTQLLDKTVDAEHEITATVNGEPFTGDPSTIVLRDEETIVLQYGPPFGTPPTSPFE